MISLWRVRPRTVSKRSNEEWLSHQSRRYQERREDNQGLGKLMGLGAEFIDEGTMVAKLGRTTEWPNSTL